MNEADLRLLGMLPQPALLVSAEGTILAANEGAAGIVKERAASLAGRKLSELVTDAGRAEAYLRACAGSAQLMPGSITFSDTGSPTAYRCDGALLRPPAGRDAGVILILMRPRQQSVARFAALNEKIAELSQVIAERMRAQEALQRSEERYRTVIAATTSVVMVADAGGEFAQPQPSWEEFTGQSWPESLGFGWIEAIDPADRERFRNLWKASVAAASIFECEARVLTAGSSEARHCLFRAAPIRHNGGGLLEWVITAADIHERKRFDEQIRQTQKLEHLGLLAGGVAHDFNNLLVGILGNASLALETISSNNPAAGLLQDVIAAGETAAHLTRQLLAYAGKGRFIIEPLDLSDLVRQIGGLVQATIPKGVHLRYELAQALPCVDGDASQLQQLLMNLIINGAEAIGEGRGGTVLITTGVQEVDDHYIRSVLAPADLNPGQYVTLEVHDTGSGMEPEVIEKIFDPFFSTKFAGRGLGLAAVLGIVRGHKGALKVYSTPGRGTTFKVLFPASTAKPLQRQGEYALNTRGSGEMVLVADDEVIVRQATKNMLERHGYLVVLADNGREAVDLFRILEDKVSVVLLDMTMPVMSGEDAFRELKQIRPDVRVVLTSGYNEVEAVRRFTGKGLAGFIQKPFSSARLVEKIRTVIEGTAEPPA
jgi:PAS domain S-box-containing protein